MVFLRSKIAGEILSYFFINPSVSLYVNELARKLSLDKRNLVKKIRELEKEGILKSQIRGNLKLYSIDKTYFLYDELKGIVAKTAGFENKLKQILKKEKGVKEAYIYGSYANNAMGVHSDIDLLVVGSHNIILLQKKLNLLQRGIDREINIVNMDEPEFKKKVRKSDSFISGILNKKHIKLV